MTDNFFENYSNSYKLFKPHTVYNFIGNDSKNLFEYNLKNNQALLKKNNWINTEIKYLYNNYGFRTYDDFYTQNYNDVNMFFGCSLTDGVGLNIEDTWAYKINQKLGGSFYNFGQSGGGIEVAYRLLKSWTSKVLPKNIFIFIYSLHKARREFLHSENYNDNNFGPWDLEDNNISILIKEFANDMELQKQKREFYFDFLASQKEIEISYERSWDAIHYVVSKLDCNVYVPKQYKILKAAAICRKNDYYARDCFHLGSQFHDMISDFDYWEKIK
jgi:hypothetical protein